MTRASDSFVVYNLRPTYHELGEYDFKVVLDPDLFKSSHDSELDVVDSDGRPVQTTVSRWGRKINCVVRIGEDVADGVATVRMVLRRADGTVTSCNLTFWIIKP